ASPPRYIRLTSELSPRGAQPTHRPRASDAGVPARGRQRETRARRDRWGAPAAHQGRGSGNGSPPATTDACSVVVLESPPVAIWASVTHDSASWSGVKKVWTAFRGVAPAARNGGRPQPPHTQR